MKKIFFTSLFLAKEIFLGAVYASLMIVAGVFLAGFLIYEYQTPDAGHLLTRKIAQTTIIYDRGGTHELYEIHGEENRKILAHDQIPDAVRAATLAAEDKNFYRHPGVDFVATARALEVDIQSRDIRQGGSTITQQLARNVYLGREKTIWRKVMEALLAFKIERNFTKEQILDAYLNQVPYGSNAYGIQSAAEIFFGKNASEMTIDEAAFLAALPKAPAYYSPYGIHRDEMAARQKDILEHMKELGMLSPKEEEEALGADTLAKLKPFSEPIQAPHFVFYVIDQLEKEYGRDYLETGGLRIITTLDYDMQKSAEQAVKEGGERNVARGADNAGLVAVDPKTGAILAMVGSRDYFSKDNDGEVNVTTSLRQPGSSFKPIVYSAAFERGWQPETKITDSPTNFGPDGSGRPYMPHNYDGGYHGTMPMRDALARSLNVPAVKTLAMIGLNAGEEMAKRLGITTLNEKDHYGLSFAIGAATVKPLDMAGAFSVFANDGIKNTPYAVEKIQRPDGSIDVHQASPVRVLDPQVARKIDSILSDNKA
ncbi:MAG TPA: transglycosylase domain-containing protein, partial [Candidatus Bathyarchaeia archaeon]|nr:transglycosylase domain-containing protein [Candidatus Bathyarchaeia archaeon]